MPLDTVENFGKQLTDIVFEVKILLKIFRCCGKHYSRKYST